MFAGTPEPAAVSLRAVLAAGRHEVVAVLTRPPAPSGRGRQLQPSPVQELAAEHGIPVLTPRRPSDPQFLAQLTGLAPDCAPIVAYGGLLPRAALDVPRHGWVNVHFSLLPAWRGAAPVQRALIAGDDVTGVSTFRVEEGLDTGPVYGVVTESIRGKDTAGALLDRLTVAGAQLLVATLDGIEADRLDPRPQSSDGISTAAKLSTADARVDWSAPALAVDRRIRGCTPAPGAWTTVDGERLRLGPVEPQPADQREAPPAGSGESLPSRPGQLVTSRSGVLVGTGTHAVRLGDVQPAGRRAMPAADWLRGLRSTPEVLV